MNKTADLLDAPQLRQRSSFAHWSQERVRWSDTDMVGHTNNLAFAAFCETGRCMLLEPYSRPDSDQRALFLLAELRLRYLGELNWPAVVDIGTGISSFSNRAFRIVQGLFEGERCVAVAEAALVLIDEDTRRARPIPEDIRRSLSQWLVDLGNG